MGNSRSTFRALPSSQVKWLVQIGCLLLFSSSVVSSACIPPSFQDLPVQSNFNLTRFLGIWYEIKWLPGEPHNESDIWRNFYQSFQLANASTNTLQVPGEARIFGQQNCFPLNPWTIVANNSAKMLLVRKGIGNQTLLNWPYYVVQTDYVNYALIYACTSANYTYTNPCPVPVLWLFSRTTTLLDVLVAPLDRYIADTLCVNLTALEITPHDGSQCRSLPSLASMRSVNLFLLIFLFYISIIKAEGELI